ncbi:unnamed protein product [Orchesella dallaii]|uniref:Uncharacterized protein n=1 Tax=Orchesella dallaii TaxID=48710 RepID=A0ABP1S7G8_9HEXA
MISFSNSEIFDVVTGAFERLLSTANIPKESIDERLFPLIPNKNPIPTTNLNEILSPFRNCFVMVTNFQGVHLLPPKYPIIIREVKVALIIVENSFKFILVHKNMQPMINASDFHSACSSSLFNEHDWNPCIALKYEDFMMKTRPLKCQVNINLYPQDYLLTYPTQLKMPLNTATLIKYPLNFHHNLTKYYKQIKASSQPLNLLITNDTNEPLPKEMLAVWINSVAHNPNNILVQLSPSTDLFLHISTKVSSHKQTIVSIAVATVDLHNRIVTNESVSLHKLSPNFFKLPLDSITKKAVIPYKNNVINVNYNWPYIGPSGRSLSDKNKRMVCKKNPYSFVSHYRLVSSEFYKSSTLRGIVNELAVTVTQMIIPNASFLIHRHHILCKNIPVMNVAEYDHAFGSGIKVNVITSEPHKIPSVPLQMSNPMESFKFLSCGKPPQKSFGFSEFVTIFQWNVWLVIVIVIVVLFPLTLHGVEMIHIRLSPGESDHASSTPSKLSFNLFLQPFVILLEEGESFTNNNLKLSGIRWMLGSLLLAATVLSNAYKYDNVYNVIAPKKFVSYQRISQLVADNFTIYTMLSVEKSRTSWREPWPMINVSQKSSHQLQGYLVRLRRNGFINSEIFSFTKSLELNRNGTSKGPSVLLTNSKLHPGVAQLVEEIGKLHRLYFVAGQVFMEKQWKLLTDELKICNRTAVITQELFAIRMGQKLKKEIGLKYVFVGTNYVFMDQVGIEFGGWIPIQIWGNLGALKSSGIWKWWSNVITRGNGDEKYSGASEMVVERPTIDGTD